MVFRGQVQAGQQMIRRDTQEDLTKMYQFAGEILHGTTSLGSMVHLMILYNPRTLLPTSWSTRRMVTRGAKFRFTSSVHLGMGHGTQPLDLGFCHDPFEITDLLERKLR